MNISDAFAKLGLTEFEQQALPAIASLGAIIFLVAALLYSTSHYGIGAKGIVVGAGLTFIGMLPSSFAAIVMQDWLLMVALGLLAISIPVLAVCILVMERPKKEPVTPSGP